MVVTATLLLGVFIGSLHRQVQQRAPVPAASPEQAPSPEPTASVEPPEPNYPDVSETGPFDIAAFIDQHPSGKLERLWQRLGIKNNDAGSFDFADACSYCAARIFQYNLDADAQQEIVLQIDERMGEAYRYLIFKDSIRGGEAKFLGHIDADAKYTPLDPVVLVSNGRSWLVVESTAATGSGLGAWLETVYDVSNGRVTPVASYLSRVIQSGGFGFPDRVVAATPTSCEIKDGQVTLTVSYRVDYAAYADHDLRLFTTQKQAVLVGSLRDGSTHVDAARSEITAHEFETIYNFDSMGREDFLRYNQAELRAIATGKNSARKTWLREFLQTCDDSRITRGLLNLLK